MALPHSELLSGSHHPNGGLPTTGYSGGDLPTSAKYVYARLGEAIFPLSFSQQKAGPDPA